MNKKRMRLISSAVIVAMMIGMQPVYQINADNNIAKETVMSDEQAAVDGQTIENAADGKASPSTSSETESKATAPDSDVTSPDSDEPASASDAVGDDSEDISQNGGDGMVVNDLAEFLSPIARFMGALRAPASNSNATASDSDATPSNSIYLNGRSGNDDNDGRTADTAVKTFTRAKVLAEALDLQTEETVPIYITGTVSISGDITLAGIDAIVKREKNFNGYLMGVNGEATLSSITIDGNSEEANSAEGAGTSKALIYSSGTLNIKDGTVLRNNVITATGRFESCGGALHGDGGTINMTGGEICNNTANMGGGVYVSDAVMNMSGGVIHDNRAINTYFSWDTRYPAAGGGICVYDYNAILNLSDSAVIENNMSEELGGGISVGTGISSQECETLNMTGGSVSGNSAGSAGGGIYVQGGFSENARGTANISGGTISDNKMTGKGRENDSFGGGGIYVNGYSFRSTAVRGTLNLTNALITHNKASKEGGGYASCPMSVTHIYVNDGAALYSNTASKANEIYIKASYAYGAHSGNPRYEISPVMLGGTLYNWKYSSGREVPFDKLKGILRAMFAQSISLHTDVASDANAEALATVWITGNSSTTRGGGIGSNGEVNIGTSAPPIDISVTKVWEDDESTDRPRSIEIELYRSVEGSNEEPVYIGYQTIRRWKGDWPIITFENLPKTDSSGTAFEYTVKERPVDGYTSTITGSQEEGFTVTNTKKISIPVKKVWEGGAGEKAVIRLYADGAEIASCELNAGNNWQHTFTDLDRRENGRDIQYTISEDAVAGYTSLISGNEEDGFTVTNTKKISIPVKKVWEGGAGEKAVIRLYADGAEIASCELNAENNWQHTFTDLNRTENGSDIQYKISEDAVDGYTSSISGSRDDGYTVTNTKKPESPDQISIPVGKVWEGGTGEKAVIHLYADDVEIDSCELNAGNNWHHTFTNLDRTKNGSTIRYTISEDAVAGYTSSISGDQDAGFTVTNTKKISIPVKKVWEGGTGEKAVIRLYADDAEIASCELNTGNNWQYTFTDLDRTKNGSTIRYTVSEDAVDGYTSSISGNQDEGFTVTNTKPEKPENPDNGNTTPPEPGNPDNGHTTPPTPRNSDDDDDSDSGTPKKDDSTVTTPMVPTSEGNRLSDNEVTVSEENGRLPKTGDSSYPGLHLVILLILSAAVTSVVMIRRKRK